MNFQLTSCVRVAPQYRRVSVSEATGPPGLELRYPGSVLGYPSRSDCGLVQHLTRVDAGLPWGLPGLPGEA
eukprot:1394231-Pyramimonas_sp.AAC.1